MKIKQKYTSEKTSVNVVNKVYKNYKFKSNSLILDFGGGKYDSNKEYLKEIDNSITLLVYDPYNRSEEHNKDVFNTISKRNHIDYIVCSNVLNVISEDNVILDILESLYKLSDKDTQIIISIYQGNSTGIEKETSKGFQKNQKISFYEKYINKNKFIIEKIDKKQQFIFLKKTI